MKDNRDCSLLAQSSALSITLKRSLKAAGCLCGPPHRYCFRSLAVDSRSRSRSADSSFDVGPVVIGGGAWLLSRMMSFDTCADLK